MADTLAELPPGILAQRVSIEFFSPPQWGTHCRIEVEGRNRHNVPFGATFTPSSRTAAIALAAQIIDQAKADF